MESQKMVMWRVLGHRVIVVAKEGQVNDWAAYIDAVPGQNHNNEWQQVRDHGDKISERVARVLFPEFDKLRYRP